MIVNNNGYRLIVPQGTPMPVGSNNVTAAPQDVESRGTEEVVEAVEGLEPIPEQVGNWDGQGFVEEEALSAAFFDAVKEGDLTKIKALVELGADVNQVNQNGLTALHFAAKASQREVVSLLVNYFRKYQRPPLRKC